MDLKPINYSRHRCPHCGGSAIVIDVTTSTASCRECPNTFDYQCFISWNDGFWSGVKWQRDRLRNLIMGEDDAS
jgi:ribosomal protein L37AE/L43A